ncbi:MAG: hypothetical protein Q9180_001156 [Flavoplaca navasiana]
MRFVQDLGCHNGIEQDAARIMGNLKDMSKEELIELAGRLYKVGRVGGEQLAQNSNWLQDIIWSYNISIAEDDGDSSTDDGSLQWFLKFKLRRQSWQQFNRKVIYLAAIREAVQGLDDHKAKADDTDDETHGDDVKDSGEDHSIAGEAAVEEASVGGGSLIGGSKGSGVSGASLIGSSKSTNVSSASLIDDSKGTSADGTSVDGTSVDGTSLIGGSKMCGWHQFDGLASSVMGNAMVGSSGAFGTHVGGISLGDAAVGDGTAVDKVVGDGDVRTSVDGNLIVDGKKSLPNVPEVSSGHIYNL